MVVKVVRFAGGSWRRFLLIFPALLLAAFAGCGEAPVPPVAGDETVAALPAADCPPLWRSEACARPDVFDADGLPLNLCFVEPTGPDPQTPIECVAVSVRGPLHLARCVAVCP